MAGKGHGEDDRPLDAGKGVLTWFMVPMRGKNELEALQGRVPG